MEPLHFTVRIEKESLSDGQTVYVALCLELDIASQGATVEEAKQNVKNAVELFLETAPPDELRNRLPGVDDDVFLTRIEVPFGQTPRLVGAGRM